MEARPLVLRLLLMPRMVMLACTIALMVGCKSHPLGPYVSPRVIGQVLAADTGQPLQNALVMRGPRSTSNSFGAPPKGAEQMMMKSPAHTDVEGRFSLASERVLSVFRSSGWSELALSVEKSGYRLFETNRPISDATTSAKGDLLLDLGQLFLQPEFREGQ